MQRGSSLIIKQTTVSKMTSAVSLLHLTSTREKTSELKNRTVFSTRKSMNIWTDVRYYMFYKETTTHAIRKNVLLPCSFRRSAPSQRVGWGGAIPFV